MGDEALANLLTVVFDEDDAGNGSRKSLVMLFNMKSECQTV